MVRQAILLAVAATAAALASASPIRIGTWNIRVGDDKEPSWPSRKADWTAQFESLRIDAGGLQEVSPVQMAFLREKFPQYEIVGDHREKDRVTGEASPVFWLKNRAPNSKSFVPVFISVLGNIYGLQYSRNFCRIHRSVRLFTRISKAFESDY